jgi:hypothetical protein
MPCPTWCSRRLAAIASGRGPPALADPALDVGADRRRRGADGRAPGGGRPPGPGRRRTHDPDHTGGPAGGQPSGPHRPGDLPDGTVTAVDPTTNRVQETMPASGSWRIGEGGPGLGFASGSLWVANADQQQVTRAEPDADPIPVQVNARPKLSPPRRTPTPCGWRPDPERRWSGGPHRHGCQPG